MANLGVVQYYVFKRPKTRMGRMVYGAELAMTLDEFNRQIQGETLLINNGETVEKPITENGRNVTTITGAKWEPIIGEPWILHSIHFGVAEALEKAKPLIISLGKENVKICKVLNHEIDVRMA